MENQNFDDAPIIEHLANEIERERFSAGNPLHMWWARLPGVTARTAVFANLVPQSHESQRLLDTLGSHPIDEEAVQIAKQRIIAEFHSDLETSSEQQRPRLLDPFSGSGSIPLAASRLGIEAHAIDINPVAYILQLCRIAFPQRYGKLDHRFRGMGEGGEWAGLATEVQYWSKWLDHQVRAEMAQLYLPLEIESSSTKQLIPQVYFWSYTTLCKDSSCGVQFPLLNSPYLARNSKRTLAFQPEINEANKAVTLTAAKLSKKEMAPTVQRGRAICPICSSQQPLHANNIKKPQLVAILGRSDTNQEYIVDTLPSETQADETLLGQRIEAVLQETGMEPLSEVLPENFAIRKYGFRMYRDLFTKRQLLVLLTFAKYIPMAHGQMLSQRYEPERAAAITTYLGLFLSNLVNYHNVFCRWQAGREQPQPIFMHHQPFMTWGYVEINPFASTKSFQAYAERLTPIIETNAAIDSPALVQCVSATSLPYPDAFFDGIVTAAPYYDTVPYADLSDLYFVWLKRSIGHLYPREFWSSLTPKTDEIVVIRGSTDKANNPRDVEAYRSKLGRALSEVERVLRPGRFFTVIIPSSKADVLQDFLELTQAAGLELVDVKRIRTSRTTLEENAQSYQAFLTFRKSKIVQKTSQALVDAAIVLKLADEGEPVLCSGLVHFLLENLEQEELEALPIEGHSPLRVRLMEYANRCENPGDLLDELGKSRLRKIARERGLSIEGPDPKDAVLKSLGFNVPEPEQTGIDAILRNLPRTISRSRLASSPEDLRGNYLTAVTEFERLLKRAIWAWGGIMFGTERNVRLQNIIGKDLDRLSLGDYQRLFLSLPSYNGQGFSERAEQLLRRAHLYSTKKLQPEFNKIVALRNRIEHNKEEYLTASPLELIRDDVVANLEGMVELLTELKRRAAIPLIVRPVRETTDVFGRRSYEIKVEDGSVREIYMTNELALGRDYYFFRLESDPRPVDPPMLLVSSVVEDLP